MHSASHEEKARLLRDEVPYNGSSILVETFPEPGSILPHINRPEDVLALNNDQEIMWRVAIVDVNGHFAVAVQCSDGCALFNTTDFNYIDTTNGENVGSLTATVAFQLLSC